MSLEMYADANTKKKLEALDVKIMLARRTGKNRLADALEVERKVLVLRI